MNASRLILCAGMLAFAAASAQAQSGSYQETTKKSGEEQSKASIDWKANEQKFLEKVAMTKKKRAECKGQATAQKLYLIKRSRFIKKCMAE
jgi:hypothetical protein